MAWADVVKGTGKVQTAVKLVCNCVIYKTSL